MVSEKKYPGHSSTLSALKDKYAHTYVRTMKAAFMDPHERIFKALSLILDDFRHFNFRLGPAIQSSSCHESQTTT